MQSPLNRALKFFLDGWKILPLKWQGLLFIFLNTVYWIFYHLIQLSLCVVCVFFLRWKWKMISNRTCLCIILCLMQCRSVFCSAWDKTRGTSVVCTYKQISVKIAIDRSTRAFFWLGECSFVISIFRKKRKEKKKGARDLGPISLGSLQRQPGPGCYLFSTEVQLFSKWICWFLKGDEGKKRQEKNQVLTTLPKPAFSLSLSLSLARAICVSMCV